MKGSLRTDEPPDAVVAHDGGIRTARRHQPLLHHGCAGGMPMR
jgi:hypothetical protein